MSKMSTTSLRPSHWQSGLRSICRRLLIKRCMTPSLPAFVQNSSTVLNLKIFENLARKAHILAALPAPPDLLALPAPDTTLHPFDTRNIYSDLPPKVRKLFDDGHYAEATFEACKYLDSFVGRHSPTTKSGESRMMAAFNENAPIMRLTAMSSDSQRDEQRGYKYLFSGTMVAIRNPRGHEHSVIDDPGLCLDHLGLVSALLRRLNDAGFK